MEDAPKPSVQDGQSNRLDQLKRLMPGFAICLIIAAAAQFLSEHYGAPQMLFALLLGMAVHFLMEDEKCKAGIEFGAKKVLRIGVALLGLRITVDQVMGLGIDTVIWVAVGVGLTILFGVILSRLMGLGVKFGVLTGGAVGICGASAALAISSIMPKDKDLERNTIFAVITVTSLSTIAMVLYPIISTSLELSMFEAGIFLGGTIHDVAQVVGAGYGLSTETGDTSTLVKLWRVALLVPVVLTIGLAFRAFAGKSGEGRPQFPLFVLGFCALVGVNSFDIVPVFAKEFLIDTSRWCLVTAIAALGIKTSLKSLAEVGWSPVILMVAQTAFIAIFVLVGLMYFL